MIEVPCSVAFCRFNPRCWGEAVILSKISSLFLSISFANDSGKLPEGNHKLITFKLVKLAFLLLKMMTNCCMRLLQLKTDGLHFMNPGQKLPEH